ncbi:hypothetical protein IPP75_06145 [Candidatus Saccharibacteria bacterium]|jgi:hypothetical protein|nr:MAG: hypothetical protein IPP75_06145 [Candidatus Saccharibacteria bacterium]
MSLREKARGHHRKGISRARSLLHKYDGHKMTTVVNHVHFERFHGFESTKHKDKSAGVMPAPEAS